MISERCLARHDGIRYSRRRVARPLPLDACPNFIFLRRRPALAAYHRILASELAICQRQHYFESFERKQFSALLPVKPINNVAADAAPTMFTRTHAWAKRRS